MHVEECLKNVLSDRVDIMIENFARSIAEKLVDNSLTSCTRWAEHRIHTPEPHPGSLTFEKFPWQKEILDCEEPMVTVQKCAQSGFSVAGLIKSLYKVDSEKVDVLYVLPTSHLASDFAKARLDQMVAISPRLRGLFIGTNNVGLKTTEHHSHIFIRGSVAESGLVSVPVGTVIVDEYDRCNPKAMPLVLERMSAHAKKHFFGLSTPTLPNYGINKQYMLGTQEHFMFECPSCSKTIELKWPESIVICGESSTDPDCHRSYLICHECKATLPHETKVEWLAPAIWVPTATAHGHRSFHLNQLYASEMTPGELVIAYHKGQTEDAAQVEFVNQKLGEPHLMEGARLTDISIDECLSDHRTDDPRPQDSSRQIVMGIDVGTFLDVVVAEYIYDSDPGYEPHLNSICKVLWAGRFSGSDFDILDRMMSEWQVQYACIDFQPETNLAKAFCRRFHGYASVVQYRRGTSAHEVKEAKDENRVSILTVDRTAFLDMSLGRIHKQRTLLPSNISPVFREHVKNLVKTYVLDEFGRPRSDYVSLEADHQAHALTLTEVAHLKVYSKTTGRNISPHESTSNF